MRKVFLAWMILLSGLPFYAQQSFSLEEAIDYAIQNSNAVKAANLDVQDADAQIVEFRAIGLPQVDASLNYQYYFKVPVSPVEDFVSPAVYGVLSQEFEEIQPFQGEPDVFEFSILTKNNVNATIDAKWLLFDGSYLSGLKAAKLFRELTRKSIDVQEEEIRASVTKAYMNILIAEENKKIIFNNISNIEKALSETRLFYENGFLEQLDVDRLELSLATVRTEYEKIDQLIAMSYNLLRFQMTAPLDLDIQLSEDLQTLVDLMTIEVVDMSEELDFNKRAQYSEILLGKDLNELNVERLKRGYLPNLMAKAGFSESLQREKLFDSQEISWIPTGFVSLVLNIPIFDGLQKKGQIQQAQIVLDQLDIQKVEFERAVSLQVMNARLNYTNSKKNLENVRNSLTIIENIYNKTIIKFQEGVGSSIEVTQAENQLFDVQGQYINALYDLMISKTDLEIALGNI